MPIPTQTRRRSGTISRATSAAAPPIPRSSTRSRSRRASARAVLPLDGRSHEQRGFGSCVPSPACGEGTGRGHAPRFVRAFPHPNPSPQAGEGGHRVFGTHAIECRMFQTRTEDISAERRPVAFGDLRGFIEALRAQGELAEIDAEVDWNIELGTVMRLAQGPGNGKALIFNNIKDYNAPT